MIKIGRTLFLIRETPENPAWEDFPKVASGNPLKIKRFF
jgi:hypothetical protein